MEDTFNFSCLNAHSHGEHTVPGKVPVGPSLQGCPPTAGGLGKVQIAQCVELVLLPDGFVAARGVRDRDRSSACARFTKPDNCSSDKLDKSIAGKSSIIGDCVLGGVRTITTSNHNRYNYNLTQLEPQTVVKTNKNNYKHKQDYNTIEHNYIDKPLQLQLKTTTNTTTQQYN